MCFIKELKDENARLVDENTQLRKQLTEALSGWVSAQDLAYQRLVLLHIHCPEQVKKTS